MTFKPGDRIGSYAIESLVGDSGLGDVWKARDVVTSRAIALRMLPAAPPHDPERFARFDRDIRALQLLSHPNIPAVDGIVDVGGRRTLAVAWVDGPSLAERLQSESVSIDEIVIIATQIANAVGAAHDQAVVHGNLQPRNIKTLADSSVWVLDLGLNALFNPEMPHLAHRFPSPLARAMATIIGTASYMSPEQVQGACADARSDVWAFGCIVFEMLAGRPAFVATDVAETFALILAAEPEWTRIPPSTPAALVMMVKACLTKDVSARRQNLSGLSIDLEGTIPPPGAHEALLRDSLFDQEAQALKRWLKGRVPQFLDLDEDDLVHQAITDTWRSVQGLPPPHARAVRAYSRQTVMNRICDEVRRTRRPGTTPPDDDDEHFPGDPPEIGPAFEETLAQLPGRDRELIIARVKRGLSYEEIAKQFSLAGSDAARVSIARAIKRLVARVNSLDQP